MRSSRGRYPKVSGRSNLLLHKFMEQAENLSKKVYNHLILQSFYDNSLSILMDTLKQEICEMKINHEPHERHEKKQERSFYVSVIKILVCFAYFVVQQKGYFTCYDKRNDKVSY